MLYKQNQHLKIEKVLLEIENKLREMKYNKWISKAS